MVGSKTGKRSKMTYMRFGVADPCVRKGGAGERRGRLGEVWSSGNVLFFPPGEHVCVYCFSLNSLDSLPYEFSQ